MVTSDKHNRSNIGESAPKMMIMMRTMVMVCTIQVVVFWDETPCSFSDGCWRFVGIYCLQLQDEGEDGGSIFLLKILIAYKIIGCQNPRSHNLNSYLLESPKSYTCIIFTITIINQFSLNWTFSNILPFWHQSSRTGHGLNISLLMVYKFAFPKYDVSNTRNAGLLCSKEGFTISSWKY
jgi:hypothetical protein